MADMSPRQAAGLAETVSASSPRRSIQLKDLCKRSIGWQAGGTGVGIYGIVRIGMSQADGNHDFAFVTIYNFLDEIQADALHAASVEKRDSIPESGVLAPVETGRVVKGLAVLTAQLQSTSSDKRHLRSTERGLFYFADTSECEGLSDALGLVSDAAEAGFLRLHEEADNIRYFRVHSSLAPAYGFSYRGAYYPVPLSVADFEKLKSAETEDEIAAAARAIAKAIPGDNDLPLFKSSGDHND